jgi:hypothetical protein
MKALIPSQTGNKSLENIHLEKRFRIFFSEWGMHIEYTPLIMQRERIFFSVLVIACETPINLYLH